MKKALLLAAVWLSTSLGLHSGEALVNLLWDGGFNMGLGNGFWTVCTGNHGPNLRRLWRDGTVSLELPIGSRAIPLEDGSYTLSAWVRRTADNERAGVELTVTNLNHHGDKHHNEWSQRMSVSSLQWQRVVLRFKVEQPVRRLFHVELRGESVEVDAVMMSRGEQEPMKYRAAEEMECGFFVAEETQTFVDGESRDVDLVVANHAEGERDAEVSWQCFDHRETKVRDVTLRRRFIPGVTRIKVPLDDLAWGGYRLACQIKGSAVRGDALCAILPRVDPAQRPFWGADANIQSHVVDYTARLMGRLGMNTVNTLSCSGGHGRWGICNPAPGEYRFQDEAVDRLIAQGIEVVGFLGLKHPPEWVVQRAISAEGPARKLSDETFFTKAFVDYVEAYVRHFAGRVKTVLIEDEIHNWEFDSADHARLASIFDAARVRAQAVARSRGAEMSVSLNATDIGFWKQWLGLRPGGGVDFVSANHNLRPQATAELLNLLRERGVEAPELRTIGVGQPGVLRATSLKLDRPSGVADPPGKFVWMALEHFWMDRAWGVPAVGPSVRFGYYDWRTLGQSAYLPIAGKSGIEYDNSPTLGMQGIAMLKHQIQGMSPVRDATAAFSAEGFPTAGSRLFAYPFRSEDAATIVLSTADGHDCGSAWRLSGVDLRGLDPRDIFAQPIVVEKDVWIAKELPVYLRTTPDRMMEVLASLRKLGAEPAAAERQFRLTVAPWTIELDADSAGMLKLFHGSDGARRLIIDGIAAQPALPKPKITVNQRTGAAEATIEFLRYTALVVSVDESGCKLEWRERNNLKDPLTRTVRFRVSQAGAGRDIVIQEGGTVQAGWIREDYGEIRASLNGPTLTAIDENASTVSLKGFARFELAPASGNAKFSPRQGLRWKTLDGEAWLQQTYHLEGFPGGGSRNVSGIHLSVNIR